MSKNKSTKTASNQIIVLFGVDEDGKTQAARFTFNQKDLALKAAGLMKLDAYEVDPATQPELFSKIPAGRLYSNGKGFVPYVRRDRYAKLLEALGVPSSGVAPAPSDEPLVAQGLPDNWQSITPGHLVLAREDGDQEGWWEAIITKCEDDMLTLRFRDYPKMAPITRHRTAVALLNPASQQ
jgi:hypothetical protein